MDCSLNATLPKPKTVSVNGVVISRESIAREVQNHPAEKPILAWQAAARALAIRELLLQEARRLAIAAEPLGDEDGRLETDEEAQIRALLECEVHAPVATDGDCRRFYDRNQTRFVSGTLVEAAHILIAAAPDSAARRKARTEAETLLAAIKDRPERFGEIARERSDCRTSAAEQGRLGQIGPGDTSPDFEAALARLQVGEIALVETRYGYHIVRVDQRAEGRLLPFELVHDRIAAWLEEGVRRRAMAQYVAVLAGRASISGIALKGVSSPLVQ